MQTNTWCSVRIGMNDSINQSRIAVYCSISYLLQERQRPPPVSIKPPKMIFEKREVIFDVFSVELSREEVFYSRPVVMQCTVRMATNRSLCTRRVLFIFLSFISKTTKSRTIPNESNIFTSKRSSNVDNTEKWKKKENLRREGLGSLA